MLLRSTLLVQAGFDHALPQRSVTDRDLLDALGVDSVTQVDQVHGARVVEASEARGQAADALVARAREGRVAVGVRVADCVPVLVGDEVTGDVAAIHAGWRGVVAGVVPAAVERLGGRCSCRCHSIVVAIGPCIESCCFEVGHDVAEALARASPSASVVVRSSRDKAFVDLRAAVRAQLRSLGVSDSRIEDVAGCTKHSQQFHSFRRDGANSGRMLAAIATRRVVPHG